MRTFLQLVFTTVILSAHCVSAGETANSSAQARIGAPIIGYVFDPSVRSIRPVLGTPGASIVGDPLDLGLSLALAAVSPKQDFAVLAGADDSLVRVISLQYGGFNSRILAPAASAPKQIVFSPSGGAVGLYQPDSARLQIFTHMPQNPALSREIGMSGLTGNLLSFAISDDGELTLILTGSPDNPDVWLSPGGANAVRLEVPPSTSAMAFASGSHDAVMATRNGQIYLLRDLLQNAETSLNLRVLSPPDDRTSDPVAVQFSPDGTRAYVATRQGTLAGFGIQTDSAAFISCQCRPSGLVPFYPSMLFRLNEFSDGPLLLLDAAQPELRVWFVPAVIPATSMERAVPSMERAVQ